MRKTHVAWSNDRLASDPPFEPDYYIVTVQNAKFHETKSLHEARLVAMRRQKTLPPMKLLEIMAIKEN